VSDTIEYHINPQEQPVHSEVTVIVHTADLFCHRYGLGYGYELSEENTQSPEQVWDYFCQVFPRARISPESEYAALVCGYVEEAKSIADHVFSEALPI
jgi:hypothetical protein